MNAPTFQKPSLSTQMLLAGATGMLVAVIFALAFSGPKQHPLTVDEVLAQEQKCARHGLASERVPNTFQEIRWVYCVDAAGRKMRPQ